MKNVHLSLISLALFASLFVVTKSVYSEEMAKYALAFSKISYCEKDLIKNWSCGTVCNGLKGIESVKVIYNDLWST